MILFKKLHSHFGALAVTFAEFQIIQDELLALIFNGGLYGIFGIIYVFHYILVSQFHTADTDGTFLFLGDLIDGEAQEKSSLSAIRCSAGQSGQQRLQRSHPPPAS